MGTMAGMAEECADGVRHLRRKDVFPETGIGIGAFRPDFEHFLEQHLGKPMLPHQPLCPIPAPRSELYCPLPPAEPSTDDERFDERCGISSVDNQAFERHVAPFVG